MLDPGGDNKPFVPYTDWPIPNTDYRRYYLDASTNSLTATPPAPASTSYDAKAGANVVHSHLL